MSMITESAFREKIKDKIGRDLDEREREVSKRLYDKLRKWYEQRPQFVEVKNWDGPVR